MTAKPDTAAEVLAEFNMLLEGRSHDIPADIVTTLVRISCRLERAHANELASLLPGPDYMDPPDGGDVTLLEQCRRMSEDAAKWRALSAQGEALDAVMRARGLPAVKDALGYSRNFATANPHLTTTAAEHITGLCDMLEIAASHPAPAPNDASGAVKPQCAGQLDNCDWPRCECLGAKHPAPARVTKEMVERGWKAFVMSFGDIATPDEYLNHCTANEMAELKKAIDAAVTAALEAEHGSD